ncbi:MAG: flagellar hook-basal body complex protein FliE [Polyangiaceae bacterium]
MIEATHSVLADRARVAGADIRIGDAAAERTDPASSVGFGDVLGSIVGEVNATQEKSAAMTGAFASGAIDDVHGTMIAMKKAEISLRLVGSIRNKLVDAFQELWRTNV